MKKQVSTIVFNTDLTAHSEDVAIAFNGTCQMKGNSF